MKTTYNDSLIKTNSFTYSSSFPHLLTFNNSNSFVYDGLYLKQIKNNIGQVIKQFNYRGTKISSIQEPLQNKSVLFEYDYQGRRIKKLYQPSNDLIEYYYDDNLLIKEKHSNYLLNFLYNENNELIGFEHISLNNSAKSMYFYLRNAFNDVVEILDANGNSLVHYLYDAFGNTIETIDNSSISLGVINPFRYRGYYYDVESQFYWVSSRYYSPELCRWISPDSIEYLDTESINGLNLYAYCNNNPVNYYDPTGHSAILIGLIIGAIIGAGIGFGTVVYTDYLDDGQIFNGSVKWYEYVGGTATGAILGAGVGGIIGAGGAVLTNAMSSVTNKFISDLFVYTLTGTSFGTWEDYAVAFISGGLIKGLKMKGIVKTAFDVAISPAINQVVKIGTNRTETFNAEKYAYDIVTRGLTTFAPSPWKAIYRGGFRSMWDLYKRGYFA